MLGNSAFRFRCATFPSQRLCRQSGSALIVALLMLIAVLMLGTSAAQISLQGEKASRNDGDRQVALQAAEAALMDAQLDMESSPRSHLFTQERTEGFADGCDSGHVDLYLGLCRAAASGSLPVWLTVDFLDAEQNRSVPYGRFTGRLLQTGAGLLPTQAPRYIIELMSHMEGEHAAATNPPISFYRITAIGFGLRASTQVVLQTYYRKDDGGSRQSIVPKGRFGWREISNWQEMCNARSNQ